MNLINFSEGFFLAIHSLILIEKNRPKRLSAKIISEELHSSQAHLAKIFQKLSKANIVSSIRGPHGGFVINKNPEDISFLDIYEIIEGEVILSGCVFNKTYCAFKTCIFNGELNKISKDIYEKLKNTNLANVR